MTVHHHPPDELLGAFAAGTLDLGQHVAIATHLVGCAKCRGAVQAMEHVGGAVLALYLNVFVLVVQSFMKVPALNALAPNGNEPPFAIAQGVVLVIFILAGLLSLRRFHPVA